MLAQVGFGMLSKPKKWPRGYAEVASDISPGRICSGFSCAICESG